jgi:hypothetical protein
MNIDVDKMDKLRVLKKTELQELLVHYKLKKTGNKPDLFERLLDYYNEHPDIPIYTPKGKDNSGKLIIPNTKIHSNNTNTFGNYNCKNNIISNNMEITKYMNEHDCLNIIHIIENMSFSYPIQNVFHRNVMDCIFQTYSHYRLKYNSSVKVARMKCDMINYETRRYLYELKHFFELLKIAKQHTKQINMIQRAYKTHILKKINKLRGPAFIKRHLCKNSEDFITYESVKYVHPDIFYSFRDEHDSCIYGFNIESLIEYIRCYKCKKILNPYNNRPISLKAMQHIITTFNELRKSGRIKKKQLIKMTPENKMKDKAIHVFHRIDMLGNYTDVNWFLDLNIYHLKTLYREAEDIWNYRAQHLTPEIKRKHIPRNDAFRLKPYKINAMTNKLQIQNIILDEFKKFITEGETEEECQTGALWMLTALVKVSPAQSEAMGWLVQ